MVLALLLPASIASTMLAGPSRAVAVEPVGHWAMDEGAGTSVSDSAAGASHGTLTGGNWIAGWIGTGAIRLGSGAGIEVPDSAALEPTTIGVSAWIRMPAGATNPAGSVVMKGGANCAVAPSYQLTAGPTYLQFSVRNLGGIATIANTLPVSMADGEWHHVAGTYVPGAGVEVFLDGIAMPQNGAGSGDSALVYGADPVRIGATGCASIPSFVGDVDDARIDPSADLSAVLAPDLATTTTLIDVEPSPSVINDEIILTAQVEGGPWFGMLDFYAIQGETQILLASAHMPASGPVIYATQVFSSELPRGSYQIIARFEQQGRYAASESAARPHQVTLHPSTTTLTLGWPVTRVGSQFHLEARVAGDNVSGNLQFFEVTPAGDQYIKTVAITTHNSSSGTYKGAQVLLEAGTAIGPRTYKTRYLGNSLSEPSTSNQVTVQVQKSPVTVTIPTSAPIQEHHAVALRATVVPQLGGPGGPTGGITYHDHFNGTVKYLATRPVGEAWVTTALSKGTHYITATYSGDANHLPGTSVGVARVIVQDTVGAWGFGFDNGTFYPVVDGFRDKLGIKGSLKEAATVSIKVVSAATGATVRTINLGTKSAPYVAYWDGRTTTGALSPAGSYRVTQTLTDTWGNKLSWTGTVTVSLKKLVTRTGTTTLYANQATAATETGVTTTTKYYRGLRLRGNLLGANGVGYQFTLPSAITYKSMSFGVLGSGGGADTRIAFHDWRLGNFGSGPWIIDWFTPRKVVGTAYAWTSTSGNVSYHRSGRTVQAAVISGVSDYYIAKVRLTYSYTVLQ